MNAAMLDQIVQMQAFAKDPATLFSKYSTRILAMETPQDYLIWTLVVFVGYSISYLGTSAFFEFTNPAPKDEKRIAEIKKEVTYGVTAMVMNVVYATTWLCLVDRFTPFYGYYEGFQYNLIEFAKNMLAYMLIMDTWFYWTHRLLHNRWMWARVHWHHHQFIDPTAFAQDAVHPFEAVLQGPMGHHIVTLLVPMHPVSHAIFGFMTAVYAIAAHDGRMLDLNDHVKHHHYANCNFGLYWGLWDYICGTRYNQKRFQRLRKFDRVDRSEGYKANLPSDQPAAQ